MSRASRVRATHARRKRSGYRPRPKRYDLVVAAMTAQAWNGSDARRSLGEQPAELGLVVLIAETMRVESGQQWADDGVLSVAHWDSPQDEDEAVRMLATSAANIHAMMDEKIGKGFWHSADLVILDEVGIFPRSVVDRLMPEQDAR